jgi:hypothetical protein
MKYLATVLAAAAFILGGLSAGPAEAVNDEPLTQK